MQTPRYILENILVSCRVEREGGSNIGKKANKRQEISIALEIGCTLLRRIQSPFFDNKNEPKRGTIVPTSGFFLSLLT